MKDVKVAGTIASNTRKQVEDQLGHSIVTRFNDNKIE
jgi:hypothetical protein